jgi:predicted 3-demethylubiquinone-9 3-methyltransferase (glyoxalase superfamily)
MEFKHKITPCLWFDSEGEEAAKFYTSIFPDSRITQVTRYTEAGHEVHGQPAGKVLVVAFELAGQSFTALNGGPNFKLTEAVSFQIMCDDQKEVDYYWDRLSAGGDPAAQQCSWLKDRFGLSWQVVPKAQIEMLSDSDTVKAGRAMNAMMGMKKLDIAALQKAFRGE